MLGRVFLLLGLLAAPWARADAPVPVPVEELARRADWVVHGRVASLEASRDAEGRIFTRVELEQTEIWKGLATNHFSIVFGNAVLGDRWTKVVGGPEFRLGEEVVVFAIRNPNGDAVTLDLAQGKFTVREVKDGPKLVSNGVLSDAGVTTSYRLPTQVPLSLDELKRRVDEVKP